MSGRRFMTTGDVAEACGVSVAGVKKWIRARKLGAFKTPGGHFRVTPAEFRRFRAVHRFPSSEAAASRVLIVDDDPAVVDMVRDVLSQLMPEVEVESAMNGYEGLLKVGALRPRVLLLDLKMPGLDGVEVCRRIKANPAIRSTRIVVMTAYPEAFAVAKLERTGADALLGKPFNVGELTAVVRRQLRARRRSLA